MGAFEDSQYPVTTFQLEADDVLVAYTDGITEAENSDGEAFGQQRLEGLLCFRGRKTPQEIIQRILDQVSTFTEGGSQKDDMTLLVMQMEENK